MSLERGSVRCPRAHVPTHLNPNRQALGIVEGRSCRPDGQRLVNNVRRVSDHPPSGTYGPGRARSWSLE